MLQKRYKAPMTGLPSKGGTAVTQLFLLFQIGLRALARRSGVGVDLPLLRGRMQSCRRVALVVYKFGRDSRGAEWCPTIMMATSDGGVDGRRKVWFGFTSCRIAAPVMSPSRPRLPRLRCPYGTTTFQVRVQPSHLTPRTWLETVYADFPR